MLQRSSGIILHVSSLPGAYGIGDLGPEAYRFVDQLDESESKIWQILPLAPIGNGNSPYQSISVFAGERLFISPDVLVEEGLLKEEIAEKAKLVSGNKINYPKAGEVKNRLLHLAFSAFKKCDDEKFHNDFDYFRNEHGWWLNDYALFYVINRQLDKPWNKWPDEIKNRNNTILEQFRIEYEDELEFVIFVQFMFYRQWFRLKEYANSKGIQILGDLPLYVSHNSADVWANQHLFLLDENGEPEWVGGVPPDYFSEDGQLWGNPVYNWLVLRETNYQWWKARMNFNFHMYNQVRVDHFRGLEQFWAIPGSAKSAKEGKWMLAFGYELFESMVNERGQLPVIAEDLGLITPEVVQLRKSFGFPGMKVLQFAFLTDETNEHLPHNYEQEYVAYTGTHDNNTLKGWINSLKGDEKKIVSEYYKNGDKHDLQLMIEWIWGSVTCMAIMPVQDLIGLGKSGRLNVPGVASGNWSWKLKDGQLSSKHIRNLKVLNKKYNRRNG